MLSNDHLKFENVGEGTGGLSSANGDWDGDDCYGAGGVEGCGVLIGAFDRDGIREIGDGVLGEGESAAGCSNGVG
ncbi:hypothetical protein L3X38_041183 [Prunus dulcis]|uniref:Uncharacterized protein n=1 Tax=Prunus dulcis TaxID=3755 RepID=A0AAD4YK45_PRUDU|nr:hypothetical protein L3X38_041183 [Prunus dulcis]